MSTADDVFRRLPVARTVQLMARANERDEVKALLPHVPRSGVLRWDRGYPSYELIDSLQRHSQGYWLIRCPASATVPAVEAFVQSGRAEAVITLQPPQAEPIRRRVLRLTRPEGELSALLTNLGDPARFPAPAVIDLDFRRWAVEVHDRDEKTSLAIETFPSQIENSLRQELFAILIMAVIVRTVMVLITDPDHPAGAEPQFKVSDCLRRCLRVGRIAEHPWPCTPTAVYSGQNLMQHRLLTSIACRIIAPAAPMTRRSSRDRKPAPSTSCTGTS